MSVEPLTWSELDRLADYSVDALEPADAAQVAQLIEADDRWATAYRDLVAADAAVRLDLAAAADVTEAMPPDVTARLDTALFAAAVPGPAQLDAAQLDAAQLDAAQLPAASVDASAGPAPDRAGLAQVISIDTARRRRRTFAAAAASAAAVVVAVVGGIALNSRPASPPTTAMGGADVESEADRNDDGAAPAAAPTVNAGLPTRIGASGTNYLLGTLATMVAPPPPSGEVSGAAKSTESSYAAQVAGAPSALADLTAPDGLRDCLDGVLARYPGAVTALDFARYAGDPALIVAVSQGQRTVVIAVGPACDKTDPHELAHTTTG